MQISAATARRALRTRGVWFGVGGICLALLALGIFFMRSPGGSTAAGTYPELKVLAAKNDWSFPELSDYFTTLANKKGAVYAFNVLKGAPVPPGIDLHLLGHTVGDVLYKQEGVEGIKECTQDLRNACSHAIVIGALQQFGTGDDTIAKIEAACKKAPGGIGAYTMCYHGLGHGVFAYYGYKIPETVAFCERLGTATYHEQEATQCVGGMVMELVDGGGHDHDQWAAAQKKYLSLADPLAPCDSTLIPNEAKSFCYTYLTPHLFVAAGADLGNPDPATFAKAFSFCTPITDARLRDVCYAGFGKEFIPLAAARDIRSVDTLPDETYQKAIGWCMQAPTQEAQSACLSQALASVFWGGENNPDASFRLCSLVGDTAVQRSCYKNLAANISQYASGASRATLCARLPSDLADVCLSGRPS